LRYLETIGPRTRREWKTGNEPIGMENRPMNTITSTRIKGKSTFRIAAVLFVVSALLELPGLTSGALLFGSLRGGFIGIAYHLVTAALYVVLGLGLWQGTAWGYRLVFVATLLYSLDKMQYLFYRDAMLAQMLEPLGTHRQLWQTVDPQLLLNVLSGLTVLFVLCWWGFAGYTYMRRAYFMKDSTPNASDRKGMEKPA
jgi:hypothetical protein